MATRENPVARACAPLVRLASIIMGYGLLGLSFLIAFDVVARKLFDFSTGGASEIGGYVVAILAAFGFTYALLEHAHTRIDIFYSRLPPWPRAIANLVSMLGMFVFAVFMAWRAWASLRESIAFHSAATTPLHTPLWIPQSLWFAGLLFFAVVSGLFFVHALYLTIRDKKAALKHYGPQTLKEEIEQEITEVEGLDEPLPASEPSRKGALP